MDPAKQREIASKGGKAAHEKGTAHEFTSEEARIAGKKGGAASRARRGKSDGDNGDNGATMTQAATEAGSEAAPE
jgi:general stress protein YciG